jgi:hypothetical protein
LTGAKERFEETIMHVSAQLQAEVGHLRRDQGTYEWNQVKDIRKEISSLFLYNLAIQDRIPSFYSSY